MRKIEYSNAFKKDYKKHSKGKYRNALNVPFKEIVNSLANDIELSVKYKDHDLLGIGMITESVISSLTCC